jgi:hypothetical protein
MLILNPREASVAAIHRYLFETMWDRGLKLRKLTELSMRQKRRKRPTNRRTSP